jgi:ribonuclease Z
VKYAKNADLVIHECFIAVPELVTKMRFTPEQALLVGTQVHTAPEAFGKVMSAVKPRMAVAYHFFKDFDTTAAINDRIRTTYGGPLSLAEDFMVWNITKDEIITRMAVVEEATWAPPGTIKPLPPSAADREAFSKRLGFDLPFTEFIASGKWDVDDVLRPIYEETSKVQGREFPYPEK